MHHQPWIWSAWLNCVLRVLLGVLLGVLFSVLLGGEVRAEE
jgi:hypothetical protein